MGSGIRFRKRFYLSSTSNSKVIIGNNVFFNNDCSINCREKIVIGDDTIIGENVKLYDHNHRFSKKNRLKSKQGFKTSPIIIGNNCWIGSNVVILKGVKIGDNTVIGAGVVLKHSVGSNMVVEEKQNLTMSSIRFEE